MNVKTCKQCDTELNSRQITKGQQFCSYSCRGQSRRKYPWQPKYTKNYYIFKKRYDAVQVLGGKCAECGYNENYFALEIDHIDNNGHLDRQQRNRKKILDDIISGETEGLQVLCGNCHNIKSKQELSVAATDYLAYILDNQ